jgi:hypothetical protein
MVADVAFAWEERGHRCNKGRRKEKKRGDLCVEADEGREREEVYVEGTLSRLPFARRKEKILQQEDRRNLFFEGARTDCAIRGDKKHKIAWYGMPAPWYGDVRTNSGQTVRRRGELREIPREESAGSDLRICIWRNI